MYGILDRYVGKNIILSVLLVAVCLTAITAIVNLIDYTRYIGRGQINFVFLLEYLAYKIPGFFVTFFPVAILIGGVIGLGLMARNSEIVILQSIGLSKLNIGFSCVKSILPLIVAVIFLSETTIPYLERTSEDRYAEMSSNYGITITSYGTWIKEGNSFIGISVTSSNSELLGIAKYDFSENKLLSYSIAKSGKFENGNWVMSDVNIQKYDDNKVTFTHEDKQVWPLHINVDRLKVVSEVSENLSTLNLIDYINYLKQNKVDASRYNLVLYQKILSPFVMLVMMMLALSTIFGPIRSMNMGTRILAGIGLGFGYYVLNQIVAPFSLVYGVPPIIGASFATIIFAIIAFVQLNRKS